MGHGGSSMEQMLQDAGQVQVEHLYCLPYFTGERAPLWDAHARASFIGLQLGHRPQHLIRAAVEGILFNAAWIAEQLFAQVGHPQTIIVSGKMFRLAWVGQLLADILNRPVQEDSTTDASVLGAVKLAHLAYPNEGVFAKPVGHSVLYYPLRDQHRIYHERGKRFRHLVHALR